MDMGGPKYQREKLVGFVAVLCSLIAVTASSVPGCYVDTGNPTALMHKKYTSVSNTQKMCRYFCGLDGFTYAGVENGNDCWCGEKIRGAKAKNDDQGCRAKKCPGDSKETCGGKGRIWIVLSTRELPACFKDANTGTFTSKPYEDAKTNTQEKCQRRCGFLGYVYAAVQNGAHCHCLNAFGELEVRPAEDSQCNKPCPGNKRQTCGGVGHKWIMPAVSNPDRNCITQQRSNGYRGLLAVSVSNKKCMPWGKVLEKGLISGEIASLAMDEKKNGYCRNIDKSVNGPWCFVDMKGTREDCYVPICKVVKPGENCMVPLSFTYTGTRDIALMGEECMVWSKVKRDERKAEISSWSDKDKNSNYCRSFKNLKPACYISRKEDVFMEDCGVPQCNVAQPSATCMSSHDAACIAQEHVTCLKYEDGFEYIGSMSQSATGRRCLPWSHERVQIDLHKSQAVWEEYKKWPKSIQMSNLCRNPDKGPYGPWCYVSIGYRELCHIEICAAAPVIRPTGTNDQTISLGLPAEQKELTMTETKVERK